MRTSMDQQMVTLSSVSGQFSTVKGPTINDSQRLSQNGRDTQECIKFKQEATKSQSVRRGAADIQQQSNQTSQEGSLIAPEAQFSVSYGASEGNDTSSLDDNNSSPVIKETNSHLETQRHEEHLPQITHSNKQSSYCKLCRKSLTTSKTQHVLSVHMKVKPFLCNMCIFDSGYLSYMKKHVSTVHKTNGGDQQATWTDRRVEFREQMEAMMEKCFETRKSTVGQQKKTIQVSRNHCGLCDKRISGYRGKHVRQVHVDDEPLVCSYCNYTCELTQTLQRHCLESHLIQEKNWTNGTSIYNREAVIEEVKKLCFSHSMSDERS